MAEVFSDLQPLYDRGLSKDQAIAYFHAKQTQEVARLLAIIAKSLDETGQ